MFGNPAYSYFGLLCMPTLFLLGLPTRRLLTCPCVKLNATPLLICRELQSQLSYTQQQLQQEQHHVSAHQDALTEAEVAQKYVMAKDTDHASQLACLFQ